MRALDGILVADFSRVLAGPYATMLLGDLGADVVKVERPGTGDDTRAWGPPFSDDGMSTYFRSVNRNKRSVALDLGDPDDRRLAQRLVAAADVVVHNFRPAAAKRCGLDYATVAQLAPRAVYCDITGFGDGAGADLPGYDLIVQAAGGLMSITGTEDDPTKVGVALVDVLTGVHAAVGILAALRVRERTGRGQRVSLNLLGTLLASLVNQSSAYVGAGVVPRPMGNAHPSIAPYEVVWAADGALALAVGNDAQFARLCDILGLPELAADQRFIDNPSRVAHRSELVEALGGSLSRKPAAQWFDECMQAGVPCAPINDIGQAFQWAEGIGVVAVADSEDGSGPTVADPIGLSQTPVSYRSGPPGFGADSASIRAWLEQMDPPHRLGS